MTDIRRLLDSLGFLYANNDLWQRKTEFTNIIVKVTIYEISIWHGDPTIDHMYAKTELLELLWLETEIAKATMEQLSKYNQEKSA